MRNNTAMVIIFGMYFLAMFGILYVSENSLRQQSIEMQESRPYAVIGE